MSASLNYEARSQEFSALQRPSVPEASYEAFFRVVERLDQLLDEEIKGLREGDALDLPELTRRKRQGFLELDKLMRSFEGTIPSQDIINRLASFRTKLDENGTVLRLHLQAAQDITATIVRVMQEMESDGTYTRAFFFRGFEFA
jgi:hypothetical protein